MPIIRNEYRDDFDQIREVNKRTFGQTAESDLIDALRDAGKVIVSLVAEENRYIAGHILFSPAQIEESDTKVAALGPVAVLPSLQQHGIGTMLVQEGIASCRKMGYQAVVVLGHPEFYSRFGFKPASGFGILPQWDDIPDEAFMVRELIPGALDGVRGMVRYAPQFDL